jgi:DeoR family glycerol-3-phosphate regulon repressor
MDPEEERQNDDYSLPARRQNDLLRLAHSRGQVLVNDLAELFEVSVDTIRRDLDALASRGLLTRTHGGRCSG